MLRYVALCWNAPGAGDSDLARQLRSRLLQAGTVWECVFEKPGTAIYCTGRRVPHTDAYLLCPQSGVVIGALFRKSPPYTISSLSDRESESIAASHGRHLVDAFWGNYVAFVTSRETCDVRILRGPCSTLPCLRSSVGCVTVYFSFMEDFARLQMRALTVNWRYVARALLGPLLSEQTGINEVSEVMPGTCDRVTARGIANEVYWNPFEIARQAPVDDIGEAARRLESVLKTCVSTWTAGHTSVLQTLSGGLDSSIVLASLASAPHKPRMTSLTLISGRGEGDERHFSRVAARHCGSELHEHTTDPNTSLESLRYTPRFETPANFVVAEHSRALANYAASAGASIILWGRGGDEVFCRHHTRYYVCDYARARGVGKRFLGLALDSAVKDRLSMWAVLGLALRETLFPSRFDLLARSRAAHGETLLRANILESALHDAVSGSWTLRYARNLRDVPRGRLWQIHLITAKRDYYDPYAAATDPLNVMPILSQPVVDLCLTIPTFLQMTGRVDRAVARRAFAHSLPAEIVWRRSKGGALDYASRLLQANQRFIREMLSDGLLVQRGIVDAGKVAFAVSDAPANAVSGPSSVLALLAAEVWARKWAA